MIQAIAKLLGAASSSRVDALSRQVADLSVESVCQLVRDEIQAMNFAEARGYVRARAAACRAQARATGDQPSSWCRSEAWLDAVVRAATERIVPLVLRQTGVGVLKAAPPAQMAA